MNQHPTTAFATISLVISLAMGVCHVHAQVPHDSSWQKETENRLKAIYDRGEFRPVKFQAQWFPDSSGYTVQELDPKTNKMRRCSYDIRTGQRNESKPDEEKQSERRRLVSPDEKRVLEFQDRNLVVRDLASGQRTPLTNRSTERDVQYRDPVWSPDGKQVAFLESDSTKVRQRAILVPEDPSYPGVQNPRFARVGEKIAELRVGVVDSDGKNVQWLPIQSTEEGFYLGQVDWARNSEEVLVEKFSRFREVSKTTANSARR